MSWRARLSLHYRRDGERTTALDRHEGPLRVLQRLYPEGPGICHHIIVHPPGGIVGGDELKIDLVADAGCHAVITTPGAARFYRSDGPEASQCATLALAAQARVEWLPMETIAHSGCRAGNRLTLTLEPGAEALGWDVLALGLPAAGQDFDSGHVQQHLEMAGCWLERGRIAADDALLRHSPLGLAGHGVLGTLWFAAGAPLAPSRRDALLEAARTAADAQPLPAGATAPQPTVVVLRALAHRVEPLMQLFMQVRAAWRHAAWGLAAQPPRVWRT